MGHTALSLPLITMWNHFHNSQVFSTSEFIEGSSNIPNQCKDGPEDPPNIWDSEGLSTRNISLMPLDPRLRSAIPQQPADLAGRIDSVCYSKRPYAYVSGAANHWDRNRWGAWYHEGLGTCNVSKSDGCADGTGCPPCVAISQPAMQTGPESGPSTGHTYNT